jgi:hypothetical protein
MVLPVQATEGDLKSSPAFIWSGNVGGRGRQSVSWVSGKQDLNLGSDVSFSCVTMVHFLKPLPPPHAFMRVVEGVRAGRHPHGAWYLADPQH